MDGEITFKELQKWPCHWPECPRRTFLFSFPVAIPLWLGAWVAFIGFFIAIILLWTALWASLLPYGMAKKFWTGKGNAGEYAFEASVNLFPRFDAFMKKILA